MDRHGNCTKHGHVDPKDIYNHPDGELKCRICGREYMQRTRGKRRAARLEYARVHGHSFFATYRIYQRTNLGVEEIIQLPLESPLWRRWGFDDVAKAKTGLLEHWVSMGLLDRGGNTFSQMSHQAGRHRTHCAGCGVAVAERVVGCKHCSDRHRGKRRRGQPYISAEHGKVAPSDLEEAA